MDGDLKGDFVNDAYSMGRISGLTAAPTDDDLELGLKRLENMMALYMGKNIGVGYTFEDAPDPNTPHNVERKYWDAIQACLAVNLLVDFGKIPIAGLSEKQKTGYSFLSSSTALVRQVNPPARMPRGSGNWGRWDRWIMPQVPLSAESIKMDIGDIRDFVEPFNSWLIAPEEIDSYTLEADTGLTVVSESFTSPNVFFRISAVGTTGDQSDGLLQVKIVVTSDDARVETRLINFELTHVDI